MSFEMSRKIASASTQKTSSYRSSRSRTSAILLHAGGRSGEKGLLQMTDAPTPRRAGASRLARSVVVRCAGLAASFALLTGGAAYAQTPVETTQAPSETTEAPSQTMQAPTETTPAEPAPTEPAPPETAPAPSPEPTSAPNEYVESVPTGGGQTPVAEAAPTAPTPAP